METCCWENEQYETRTKQTVNQAHRFIEKRFRWLNVGKGSYSELFVFSIRGHVEVRQKPNDTESGENGSRRCSGRISFSWFSYRTLSLPLRYRNRSFASRSGIPLRPSSKKSLFRISTFRTRYRKRPCYRNESGCRETANEICTEAFSYTIDHSLPYPAVS